MRYHYCLHSWAGGRESSEEWVNCMQFIELVKNIVKVFFNLEISQWLEMGLFDVF